ncbi:MAG: exosortase-associated EpsI family protein [Pirellulales bacterium]|nr:exosortase-associated EpsI family protein [Pirellulales bacterium]
MAGFALAIGVTLLSGIIHGRMSNRWGVSPDLLAIGKHLETCPTEFGDWRLQSSGELTDTVRKVLECTGSVIRVYKNEKTGEAVRVGVLLGPPGPISVHTPDICFASKDYERLDEPQRVTVPMADGSNAEFWAVTFRSRSLEAAILRVYYAWSPGDSWFASQGPRFQFTSHPYLYKIQLAGGLPSPTAWKTHDPCREFLKDFLPALKPCLTAPSNH